MIATMALVGAPASSTTSSACANGGRRRRGASTPRPADEAAIAADRRGRIARRPNADPTAHPPHGAIEMTPQPAGRPAVAAAYAESAPAATTVEFDWTPPGAPFAPVFALAGGLMLVLMGNLVWVFAVHVGVRHRRAGASTTGSTSQGLDADAARHAGTRRDFFGFFNASRIYPLDNGDGRVITEFPMFSFLLGDLHPHVMALPFVLLVVGAALTLYRSRRAARHHVLARAAARARRGARSSSVRLAFINTWDIATLAFVVVAAAFVSNFTARA